ncbi:MAG: tRNA-dihydrouridine synthase [Gammaproteobacteria bacterium]|nr:tRNA-dihydrouridine synthase [Gammaproteobacteria bacterium]
MKLILAPMEGVIDHHMRHLLTRIGGYDHCVTEFVRISGQLLPPVVFYRICPELAHGSQTKSGTPVTLQLLGGAPGVMAENAQRAVELGAAAIDINFGCPSRFTNSKAGGAILLKEPERIYSITAAVRCAVPDEIAVSAKIRLGYETTDLAMENAKAVEAANASFITVHARTRVDGYHYPARWEWLGKINDALSIPLVANGDIHSVDEFLRCRDISNCEDFMLGRGAVIQPDLARQISAIQLHTSIPLMKWHDVIALVIEMAGYMRVQPEMKEKKVLGRIKQWLVYLRRQYPEAEALFGEIRQVKQLSKVDALLRLADSSGYNS